MPKLSVITINYNNLTGLEKTAASVLGQDYPDFEYIIVDGGSNDGSRDFLERLPEKVKHISEKDNGIYHAMNKGIDIACGEYLLFLNSGDRLFSSGVISSMIPELDGTDIVYGNLMLETGTELKEGYMPDRIDLNQLMTDTLWQPVSFIRGELFRRFGRFSEQFKICGDYDFFFRTIISGGARTRYVNRFIAVFDQTGLSSDIVNHPLIKSEKEVIQKSYLGLDAWRRWHRDRERKRIPFFLRWFR